MARVLCIVLLFTGFCLTAKHQKLNLQKAIDLKLITAKAISLGGYQGFCMQLGLKNISKDSLIVLIEAGRRLRSAYAKEQDILVVKEELVLLQTGEEKNIVVKGYCCQANKCGPSKNSKYTLNTLAEGNLLKTACYLNTHTFDVGAEQQAVWAISDNKLTAGITAVNDSLITPLRIFIAGLKGEELPWYTIVSATHIYSNGVISVVPLQLKGKLEYSNNLDSYVTLTITNEKGMAVGFIKSEWLKATVKSNYEINVPVKGFAKGKYSIELTSPGQQLAKKEFEL